MDLEELDLGRDSQEGATLHLKHPVTGVLLYHGEVPQTITVVGGDSPRWRKGQFDVYRRRVKESRRNNGTVPPEALEKEAIELLVNGTIGWTAIILNGEDVPFSREAATRLYTKFSWIREQVDEFIGDRANFLKPSPLNSGSSPSESSGSSPTN